MLANSLRILPGIYGNATDPSPVTEHLNPTIMLCSYRVPWGLERLSLRTRGCASVTHPWSSRAASPPEPIRRLPQPVPVYRRRPVLSHSAFLPFPNMARNDRATNYHTVTGGPGQQNVTLSPTWASRTTNGQSLPGPKPGICSSMLIFLQGKNRPRGQVACTTASGRARTSAATATTIRS